MGRFDAWSALDTAYRRANRAEQAIARQQELKDDAMDVGVMALGTGAAAFALNAAASYRYRKEGKGLPKLGPLDAGALTAAAGLGAAILGRKYLGRYGTLAALGAGLGGLAVSAGSQGAKFGDKLAREQAAADKKAALPERPAQVLGVDDGISPAQAEVISRYEREAA